MSVQAPSRPARPGRRRDWEVGREIHPQLDLSPVIRAWAREVWSTLSRRDRIVIQEGLRAFAFSDPSG